MYVSTPNAFLAAVRTRVETHLVQLAPSLPPRARAAVVVPGTLLRSRLVARLAAANLPGVDIAMALDACVATELAQCAARCRADLRAEAEQARAYPSVWRRIGVPDTLYVGDRLLVEAIRVISPWPTACGEFTAALTAGWDARAGELRMGRPDTLTGWVAACRLEAAALFAFPARWICSERPTLARALSEAAGHVGTAWQMFDDVLAFAGVPTHGRGRANHRLPAGLHRVDAALRRIESVFAQARAAVAFWPDAEAAIATCIDEEIRPLIDTLFAPQPLRAYA